jgi:glycerophosphoryl diester phosphodiesterase
MSTTGLPIGFAHRGARAHAPENTLAAFRLALEMGATGLESDVWLTRDGVPVLDHDGEYGGRTIAETPRADLPPHVPTLAELYEACGGEVPLSLDVKDGHAALAVVAVARRHGAEAALWLCHWNWKTVAGWRALSSAIRLVDSTRARHMRTPPEARARRMAEVGIDAINLHGDDWTAEWVECFHRHGRRAFAWGLQEESEIERLLGLDVDAVYSDHVDRMMRAIERVVGAGSRGVSPR